ncbi:hypothetical protein CEXT_38991 [Caerostris extrusa]|uniref:Uncharacterized protein n=1 Tax=Caerostris extrusa TaxID=172846 RepID=A0AAV4SZ64_CAEEX|nr:hypothetical protein CEXT_38991 [Caerostris extrusa]
MSKYFCKTLNPSKSLLLFPAMPCIRVRAISIPCCFLMELKSGWRGTCCQELDGHWLERNAIPITHTQHMPIPFLTTGPSPLLFSSIKRSSGMLIRPQSVCMAWRNKRSKNITGIKAAAFEMAPGAFTDT